MNRFSLRGLSLFISLFVVLLGFLPWGASLHAEQENVPPEQSRFLSVKAKLPFRPVSGEILLFRRSPQLKIVAKSSVFLESEADRAWIAASSFDAEDLKGAIGYIGFFSNGRTLLRSSPFIRIEDELKFQLAAKKPEAVRGEVALLQEQIYHEQESLKRIATEVRLLKKDVDLLSHAEKREELQLRIQRERTRLKLLQEQRIHLQESIASLKKDKNPRRFASRRSTLLKEHQEVSTIR